MDGGISSGKYTIGYNLDQGGAGALTEATATAILLKKDASLASPNRAGANADVIVRMTAGAPVAAGAQVGVNAFDNTAVKVVKNDSGKVIGLEFYTSALLSAQLDSGDGYASTGVGSKKITSDTLVYDITDSDPADIVVQKYSDVTFDINTSANTFVYYDGNDVSYIVFDSSSANKTTDISTVVTKALYNDGDLVYVKGYVNGVLTEYNVKDLSGVSLIKGDVVVLAYDEAQKLVTAVDKAKVNFETNNLTVLSVDLSGKKVLTDGGTFKLTSDAQVIDASGSDYEVKALRDLDGITKKITVVRDAAGSGYVKTIAIQGSPTATLGAGSATAQALVLSESAAVAITADGTLAGASVTTVDATHASIVVAAAGATNTETVTFTVTDLSGNVTTYVATYTAATTSWAIVAQ
jgi:hypothetical protein